MLRALIKSIGFDPTQFVTQVNGFISFVQERLAAFQKTADTIDARLARIEASNTMLHRRIDTVLAAVTVQEELNGVTIEHSERAIFARFGDHVVPISDINPNAGFALDGTEPVTEHARADRPDPADAALGNGG